MKPYAKLRGKMAENDINGTALANYFGRTPNYISDRLNIKSPWTIDEVYKIMGLLEIPLEEILTYFPPNGGVPQKGKVCK